MEARWPSSRTRLRLRLIGLLGDGDSDDADSNGGHGGDHDDVDSTTPSAAAPDREICCAPGIFVGDALGSLRANRVSQLGLDSGATPRVRPVDGDDVECRVDASGDLVAGLACGTGDLVVGEVVDAAQAESDARLDVESAVRREQAPACARRLVLERVCR
ncbi:hypothetical protein VV01_05110 [Luteipulveratus halotolerans]|uniref:Uncharacterized protein n=1 Tax=Luteipulveratus halotolerans TaxID=1631356 RepID=A0A0L6CG29_9MICO|nr:hypothetical protein VV01_05110 [Luteipulveratus halotolerans]